MVIHFLLKCESTADFLLENYIFTLIFRPVWMIDKRERTSTSSQNKTNTRIPVISQSIFAVSFKFKCSFFSSCQSSRKCNPKLKLDGLIHKYYWSDIYFQRRIPFGGRSMFFANNQYYAHQNLGIYDIFVKLNQFNMFYRHLHPFALNFANLWNPRPVFS